MDKGFKFLIKLLLCLVCLAIAFPLLFYIGMFIAGVLGYLN